MIRTRRAYLRVLHGLVAWAHVVVAVALLELAPPIPAVGLAGLAWALSAWRMHVIATDAPRSARIVRWADIPVSCHIAAGLFGFCLWPAVLVLDLLVRHAGAFLGVGAQPVHSVAAAASYALALPLAVWAATGGRLWVRTRMVVVRLPRWPAAFDGYRIVHLSDLHVGSFDPPERARRWLRRAQATKADLFVITGDLVASAIRYYPDVARLVGELSAPDGVFVVTGNHDQRDLVQLKRQIEAAGVSVLDGRSQDILRGGQRVVIAGIGGAHNTAPRAAHLLARFGSQPTILLAHDPAVFGAAAAAGVPLTLSGHTHAGQVALPWLGRWLNMARLTAIYTRGLYRSHSSWLHVSPGLGVTGLPVRLGARPEITVIECTRQGGVRPSVGPAVRHWLRGQRRRQGASSPQASGQLARLGAAGFPMIGSGQASTAGQASSHRAKIETR